MKSCLDLSNYLAGTAAPTTRIGDDQISSHSSVVVFSLYSSALSFEAESSLERLLSAFCSFPSVLASLELFLVAEDNRCFCSDFRAFKLLTLASGCLIRCRSRKGFVIVILPVSVAILCFLWENLDECIVVKSLRAARVVCWAMCGSGYVCFGWPAPPATASLFPKLLY